MKTLLTNILLLLTTSLWAQTDLGIGFVHINFEQNAVLDFYASPKDKAPIKKIEFFNDESINSWNIRDIDNQQKWLKPEILHLDNFGFIFRCLRVKGDWQEVVVDNEKGTTYWLKKSALTTFKDWETTLKEMFSVQRLADKNQKIRNLPSNKSNEIQYEERDFFHVKSMKGDWIQIFTPDYAEDYDIKTKVISGWIKWREGKKLLIEYFRTS
jgi:hypothetical protein